jgi:hypothetical protein
MFLSPLHAHQRFLRIRVAKIRDRQVGQKHRSFEETSMELTEEKKEVVVKRLETFSASFDRFTEIITILFFRLVLPSISIYLAINFNSNPRDSAFLILLITTLVAYCLLFRPLSYLLSPTEIAVTRLAGNVRIPLAAIVSIRMLRPDELKFAKGCFGFARISGYFGRFSDPFLGRLIIYGTRLDRGVLLETKRKKFIITPDHPEKLIRAVKKLKESTRNAEWTK